MAGHHKWSEIKHKGGAKRMTKWRATFEEEYFDQFFGAWKFSEGYTTRIIEKDTYDHAVIYANAMVGEEIFGSVRHRLGRLMFIEVASGDADLNENCRDLAASQVRAERIYKERSGEYVIEAMKRFEILGF